MLSNNFLTAWIKGGKFMDKMLVWLIGAAALAYLSWKGYRALTGKSSCGSCSSCSSCASGHACSMRAMQQDLMKKH